MLRLSPLQLLPRIAWNQSGVLGSRLGCALGSTLSLVMAVEDKGRKVKVERIPILFYPTHRLAEKSP